MTNKFADIRAALRRVNRIDQDTYRTVLVETGALEDDLRELAQQFARMILDKAALKVDLRLIELSVFIMPDSSELRRSVFQSIIYVSMGLCGQVEGRQYTDDLQVECTLDELMAPMRKEHLAYWAHHIAKALQKVDIYEQYTSTRQRGENG